MKFKKIILVLALAMLVFSIGLATASATSGVKNEKKDNGITIESKEKVAKYKVTWNANGGKIGTKKTKATTVKKGSKIGKLAASPKRSGYTFKGWYTKKNGGTKITKNTKPKKTVTYYAHWKKKASSNNLNAAEKKLVGTWSNSKTVNPDSYGNHRYFFLSYTFNADGTCVLISSERDLSDTPPTIFNNMFKAKWVASGGAILLEEIDWYEGKDKNMKMWNFFRPTTNIQFNYQLSSDGKTFKSNDWIQLGTTANDISTLYKK